MHDETKEAPPSHAQGGQIEPIVMCEWVGEYDYNEEYYFKTSCDNASSFGDGGIKQNEYKFCPFCGLEIKEVKK